MNLPPGVSQLQIDRAYGFENGGDFSSPNRQICFLCFRPILQDDDFGRWYLEDESGWVPTHYSDFTDAFETAQGWCCGVNCFNDHSLGAEDDEAPQLFLVNGRTA